MVKILLIGKQNISRVKGICSMLSKVLLYNGNPRCIIIQLQCLVMLHVKRIHVVFSETPPDAGTGNPDCVH